MNPAARLLIGLLLLLAAVQLGQGALIYLKAELAQVLIARAWSSPGSARPWPWADTWPVARLQVPGQGVDLYVLDGDQGNALAFGPGHLRESAAPGSDGLTVIAGHRDTHFAFLANLPDREMLTLTNKSGTTGRYRIARRYIADIREGPLTATGEGVLLVTCYPFDAVAPNGPLRYVVLAEPAPKIL